MKESILWTLGIFSMVMFGYMSAFHAQDLVWLLVPGFALVIAVFAVKKVLKQ